MSNSRMFAVACFISLASGVAALAQDLTTPVVVTRPPECPPCPLPPVCPTAVDHAAVQKALEAIKAVDEQPAVKPQGPAE